MPWKYIAPIIVAILVLAILVPVLMVRSWTETPYGRLNTRVAILLKYSEWKKIDPFREGRPIAEIRESMKKGTAILSAPPVSLPGVKDIRIPGPGGPIPLRVYVPAGKAPFPVVVFYHGGGWVMGDLDYNDSACRKLAARTPAVVVSVDYRLAPEHPFPAAVDDAFAALAWVIRNAPSLKGDPKHIAVAGTSAGGTLAAAAALMARDAGFKLIAQALVYPVTNLTSFTTPSHVKFARGFSLLRSHLEFFRGMYLPRVSDRGDWRASPLLANNLEGLPPALVLTGEFDPLRDEGEAYAEKMERAGVEVTLKRFPGMIHGFINLDRVLPAADEAVDDCAAFIRKAMR